MQHVTWLEYIRTRLPAAAQPHALTVVLGYELMRVLERDRLLELLRLRARRRADRTPARGAL
jgi:hypothetical protein